MPLFVQPLHGVPSPAAPGHANRGSRRRQEVSVRQARLVKHPTWLGCANGMRYVFRCCHAATSSRPNQPPSSPFTPSISCCSDRWSRVPMVDTDTSVCGQCRQHHKSRKEKKQKKNTDSKGGPGRNPPRWERAAASVRGGQQGGQTAAARGRHRKFASGLQRPPAWRGRPPRQQRSPGRAARSCEPPQTGSTCC